VHTHVGVDIGARTAPEVALSILAAVVRSIRVDGLEGSRRAHAPAPATAIDPVCGMSVTIGPDAIHATVNGVDHWFCCPGCRKHFLAELAS
jgi:xanthine dehydrogenase accessory factor